MAPRKPRGRGPQKEVLIPFALACLCLVGSVALAFPWTWTTSLVGYLLAPLGTTGLIAWFRWNDIKGEQSVRYLPPQGLRRGAFLIMVASILVGIAHAWVLALEIAKHF